MTRHITLGAIIAVAALSMSVATTQSLSPAAVRATEIEQVRDEIVNGLIEVAEVREIDDLKAMMSAVTGPSE